MITIRLHDGHEISGVVDSATDADQLWLRIDGPKSSASGGFAWDQIESAWKDGKPIRSAKLKKSAAKWQTAFPYDRIERLDRLPPPPRNELPVPRAALPALPGASGLPAAVPDGGSLPPEVAAQLRALAARGELASLIARTNPAAAVAPAGRPRFSSRQVQRMRVTAEPANWDSGVAVDGLLLHVTPFDDSGQVAAVNGTLSVRLWAPRTNNRTRRQEIADIGRWNIPIRADQFQTWGVTVKLPYSNRSRHPEFDLGIGFAGQLNVQLDVRGSRPVVASVPVRLRAFSPLRDQLQQRSQSRFLPNERK